MTEGRFGAKVQSQAWSGHYTNGFLVSDYQDLSNFKYAGMFDGTDKWAIGERVNGTYTDVRLSSRRSPGDRVGGHHHGYLVRPGGGGQRQFGDPEGGRHHQGISHLRQRGDK
jgi:hypothetical protein